MLEDDDELLLLLLLLLRAERFRVARRVGVDPVADRVRTPVGVLLELLLLLEPPSAVVGVVAAAELAAAAAEAPLLALCSVMALALLLLLLPTELDAIIAGEDGTEGDLADNDGDDVVAEVRARLVRG